MIKLVNVVKKYQYQKVLKNINMELPCSGLIAITGPSGCGKTTLLHLIGGIDKKYQGHIFYQNSFDQKRMSFLFQSFHLIEWMKAKKNILLPFYYRFYRYFPYEKEIGVENHFAQKINELSLGQRQRIAFLRAISFFPDVLLCDEPTASLDNENKHLMMKLLKEESTKRLVIFVSHDKELVEEYSDEIYEMKDGMIVHHHIFHQQQKQQTKKIRGLKKPILALSFLSMKEKIGRMMQVLFALVLSLFFVVLTFSLSDGFQNQLNVYIDQLIPPSSISFRLKNHSTFLKNPFYHDYIQYVHFYSRDYELLGISEVSERYQQGKSVAIYDDSGYLKKGDLLYGSEMKKEDEIVISQNAAYKLKGDLFIEDIIGKEMMIWIKYANEVKGKKVKVVGITHQKNMECLYYYPNSYFSFIQEIFDVDHVISNYGILYVDDVEKRIDDLRKEYKDFEFKVVGKRTKENINDFMMKAKIILFFFSMFSIVSCMFLIGEVMYLEVILKKKEIAIMTCFGAKKKDILLFVLYQILLLYFVACFVSLLLYRTIVPLLNQLLESELIVMMDFLSIDYLFLFQIFGYGLCFIMMAMIIPLLASLNINTTEALKHNT